MKGRRGKERVMSEVEYVETRGNGGNVRDAFDKWWPLQDEGVWMLTSWKCFDTPRNVPTIASSFCCSVCVRERGYR
jgi:hypothetical protein